jgi:AraC-like DNA-binding protein
MENPLVIDQFLEQLDYSLQLVHGGHSFAVIALDEEWFADLGSSCVAFKRLAEAFLAGAADCHRLVPMPINTLLMNLLDEIRFTAIRGLEDRARIVQLLGKVLQQYHGYVAKAALQTVGSSSETLRQALDSYLELHYRDPQLCSIQQIKKSLGWKRHSSEKVTQYSLGCTLRRYVLEFRINKACALLIETHIKISDIAFQTGFSDLAHFTNSFKRSMGMQPSAYRTKNS